MLKVKYLAIGDSYTIGESVTEEERFPAQTVKLLKAQNIDVSDLTYIAATGWTTPDLLAGINAQNHGNDFNIVTLLIGVNDQYQRHSKDRYKIQFAALLNEALELAGNRKNNVFVLSIPDYSVTPFVDTKRKSIVSLEVDEFNAINKEITLQNGITYIDITSSSRHAENDPALIAADGLHPSGKEYAAWADMLVPLIKKALRVDHDL